MRRTILLGVVLSLLSAYSIYASTCFTSCYCPEVVRWNEDGLEFPDRCYYVDIYNDWGRCGNLRSTVDSHAVPAPNSWQLVWVAVENGDNCTSECTGREQAGESAGVAGNVYGWSDPPAHGYQQASFNAHCDPDDV